MIVDCYPQIVNLDKYARLQSVINTISTLRQIAMLDLYRSIDAHRVYYMTIALRNKLLLSYFFYALL